GGLAAAPFTGGSSLALAAALGGAVLGAVSAGTAIAAENTTGSAHNTLAKISLGTGIAGGILDAASLAGPALARNAGRMGSTGLLNVEREAAGVAEEGKVWTSETFVHEGAAMPKLNEMLPAKRANTAQAIRHEFSTEFTRIANRQGFREKYLSYKRLYKAYKNNPHITKYEIANVRYNLALEEAGYAEELTRDVAATERPINMGRAQPTSALVHINHAIGQMKKALNVYGSAEDIAETTTNLNRLRQQRDLIIDRIDFHAADIPAWTDPASVNLENIPSRAYTADASMFEGLRGAIV
ncbi:hypothetical protein, partial [Enterobacter kobei]|uniref:hypothetical protein n=1 Tax=Enterobacter kobei TaxID=208224 RepID=UPI003CF5B4E1